MTDNNSIVASSNSPWPTVGPWNQPRPWNQPWPNNPYNPNTLPSPVHPPAYPAGGNTMPIDSAIDTVVNHLTGKSSRKISIEIDSNRGDQLIIDGVDIQELVTKLDYMMKLMLVLSRNKTMETKYPELAAAKAEYERLLMIVIADSMLDMQ